MVVVRLILLDPHCFGTILEVKSVDTREDLKVEPLIENPEYDDLISSVC